MSVVSVQEIFDGRGGGTGDKDSDVRSFLVITNSGLDNKYRILASGMVPVRGSGHSTQSNLFCKNVDCSPHPGAKSPRHWLVKAEYDNQPFGSLPNLSGAADPNPVLRQTEIEGKTVTARKARTRGALIATCPLYQWNNGQGKQIPTDLSPLESTAHEAFEGIEEDDVQYVIECTINSLQIENWVADYQGCINKDPVTVRGYAKPFPRWSLRVEGFSHSKPIDSKLPSGIIITYIANRFNLHFKRDLWVTAVRNEGYFKLVNNERQVPIMVRGARPQAKVLINEDGTVMQNPTAASALYRWYADGPEADFSVFKLS